MLASLVYTEEVAGIVGLAAVGADTVAGVVVESTGHHREPVVLAAGTGGHEEVVVGGWLYG